MSGAPDYRFEESEAQTTSESDEIFEFHLITNIVAHKTV